MKNLSDVLVVIPTYHEAENIADLLTHIKQGYQNAHVLVVDDTPTKDTVIAAEQAAKNYPKEITVWHRQGKGRGSAVLDGFKKGLEMGYHHFIEMDADFSHHPDQIKDLIKRGEKYDVVIGSRYLPSSEIRDWGLKRTIFSALANRYAKTILRIPITDYTNGFRYYNRQAVERLLSEDINAKGYVVLSETAFKLYKHGHSFSEVPITFVNRRRGISNLSFHEIKEAFLSVIQIRSPRAYKHVRQGTYFIISGLIGASIDIFSLLALVEIAGIIPEIGVVLSSVLAMGVVFMVNRNITFKNKGQPALKQGVKFFSVYAFTLFLNITLSNLLLYVGMFYVLAKCLAIGLIAVVNYIVSHLFIFKITKQVD